MKKTLFALLAFTAGLSMSPAKAGTKDCQNLSTPKGTISGALAKDGKTCVYKGIPYATPPEGKLRFFPPKEHPGFTAPFKAEKFGNECPNYPIAFPPKRTWQGKEDCLFLNIWHKADEGQKKPVMFWIHGGGFITGSGSTGLYDGSLMADMGDVVVVTINYRLGLLGFLTHPEVTKATGNTGNMGLLDQVQALKWVKENITAFGGDPNNVTIFGESAGGMSVVSLLIANGTKGLFNKAIIQSGPMTLLAASKQTAEKEGAGAAVKLGCGDKAKVFDCLSKVSVDDIMKKVAPSLGLGSKPTEVEKFAFAPIVDGTFIPEHPYKMLKTGKAHKGVAIMTGVTAQEMSLFLLGRTVNSWEDFDKLVTGYAPLIKDFLKVDIDLEAYVKLFPRTGKAYDTLVEMTTDMAFHCPGWEQAALLKDGRGGPFVYMHSKPPADTGLFGKLGAFHGSELPFVFGVFSFMGFKFETPANRELSNKYIQLWTSFAHTGVPKAEGAPDWPAYDPAQPWMMNLDTKVELQPIPKKTSCDFIRQTMDKNYMGG